MNKNFKFYLSIWTILFVMFNVIVFISPNEAAGMSKFGGAFWVGYIFITLAFIGQLVISYFVFKSKNVQKFIYKIPLISISWTGLVLTLIFGTLCMVIYELPNWIGVIACFIVLGFNAIALIKASAVAEIVSKIDDKIKTKTEFIKMLTIDAEHLMNTAKNTELKTISKRVYEAVRYSDPMSSAELVETEMKIEKLFAELVNNVYAENIENTDATATEIIDLIDLRNRKCRFLK